MFLHGILSTTITHAYHPLGIPLSQRFQRRRRIPFFLEKPLPGAYTSATNAATIVRFQPPEGFNRLSQYKFVLRQNAYFLVLRGHGCDRSIWPLSSPQ